MAALVDTNVLVYRFDGRFPAKQSRAIELLKRGILDDSVRVPHQAIVEFVAAVSRPTSSGRPILPLMEPIVKRRDAELSSRLCIRTRPVRWLCAAHGSQLGWFDAHLWAYAEHFGLAELWSEDFQHDRLYGTVRAVNPFRD